MVSRSGMGGGNVLGTIRHTVSPKLWGEVRERGRPLMGPDQTN